MVSFNIFIHKHYSDKMQSMDNSNNLKNEPQVTDQQWTYNSGQLEPQTQPISQPQTVDAAETNNPAEAKDGELRWSASEFVSHEKNGGWYSMLIAGTIILSVIIYFFTRELLSVIAIIVLAIATGVYGALKPRVLDYSITHSGINVGDKSYNFSQFKSFSVIEGSAVPSIQFLPQKKIAVPLSIYVSPADLDLVVETLGNYLPLEHKERDFVDKLSSRLRF